MPRACPIRTIPSARARVRGSRSMSRTNTRSTFSSSTGNFARYASEEYPVPKSSNEIRTPSARSRARASVAASGSSIRAPSVTSSVSEVAGSRERSNALRTMSSSPGSISWWGDRLTATEKSGPLIGAHSAACWQACVRTQAPIVRIAPDSSAMAMNSAGLMSPASGCRQRISASTPTCRPSRQRNCGW